MEKAVTSRATERLEKIWKDKNEDYEEDQKHKFVKNVLLTWSSVWKMYFFLKKKKKITSISFHNSSSSWNDTPELLLH